MDLTAADIWTQRGPPLAAAPPPRLGDLGGSAPRPETSVWNQVGRRGAVSRGWPLLVPGAFLGFPSLSRVFPGREGTR